MNKNTVIAIVIVVLLLGGGVILSKADKKTTDQVSVLVPENIQENTNKIPDGIYNISVAESSLKWAGRKILIDKKHIGVIPVSEGAVEIKDSSVVDGKISFDVLGLAVDPEDEAKDQLEPHLKSPDFIDTINYPIATFTVSSVFYDEENKTVLVGDLDLNGKKNEISVPVNVDFVDGNLLISGSTEIDRTLWSINYGSGKIFDKLGDSVIDDNVEVSFSLKALSSISGDILEAEIVPEIIQ